MPNDAPPGETEIRRALAECMTVEDIDDAMGWPQGTARRRRWTAPDRGGLPSADAELGGIALWFRSTFEAWRVAAADRARPGQRSRRRRSSADDRSPEAASEVVRIGEQLTREAEVEEVGKGGEKSADPVGGDRVDGLPDLESDDRADRPADDSSRQSNAQDDRSESDRGSLVSDVGDVAKVRSGFDLEEGQVVLAEIHARWQEARVRHRDRTTVVVEYEVDQTRLGGRVQRVDIDRVRVAGQQPEPPDRPNRSP